MRRRTPVILVATYVALMCAASLKSSKAARSQLVALTPTYPAGRQRTVQWIHLRWENNTAAGVRMDHADLQDKDVANALGAFANLEFDSGTPQLNCRLYPPKERLLCISRENRDSRFSDSCCGDSITIYYRDGRPPSVLEIRDIIRGELSGTDLSPDEAATVFPISTLHQQTDDSMGGTLLLVSFGYFADALSGGADFGIIMLRIDEAEDGDAGIKVVATAAGKNAMLGLRDLGTLSDDGDDTVYRLQYVMGDVGVRTSSYINGITSFVDSKTGTPVIAFTSTYWNEVVLMTDPWKVDDVQILQRFGTPPIRVANTGEIRGYHHFGFVPGENFAVDGVNSVWHTFYGGAGLDTLTIINNKKEGTGNAAVYELEVDLRQAEQKILRRGARTAFQTRRRRIDLDFAIDFQGGARPIDVGLYAVATGLNTELLPGTFVGLKVVDSRGGTLQRCIMPQPGIEVLDGLYDPFVFIDL